ncbi:hypothetical protein TRFO_28870 [Tritrichomonas foetus]|uniref:Uncharacterized protein n=1 Tax=Tritrichomonas foetus TaxID=1144522 RepID=A0A1J4K1Q7_9EUKA|nr:hypothetical protein TRFO_28870 [Tritrichomonas foetus]|eukprot:OHT03678.1 hypothetical protein TRFO_28870 [Tritrichomonas foetus]
MSERNDASAFLVASSNFSYNALSHYFKLLRDSTYSIAPWIECDFWHDIRNQSFAEMYFLEMVGALERSVQDIQNSSSDSLHKETKTYIKTLLHLCVTYLRTFPPKTWKLTTESIRDKNIYGLNEVLDYIDNFLTSPPQLLESIISPLISKHSSSILKQTLPLFCFINLISQLHSNETAKYTIYTTFQSLFVNHTCDSSRIQLLHLLKFIISSFPGMNENKIPVIKEYLIPLLGVEDPISTLATQIGLIFDLETEIIGAAYFNLLKNACQMSELGEIPILFDASHSFIANRLVSPAQQTSLSETIVNFVRYFVKANCRCSQKMPVKDCFHTFSHMKMSKKYLERLKEKMTSDLPNDIDLACQLDPISVPIKAIRFPAHFGLDSSNLQQFFTTNSATNSTTDNSHSNLYIHNFLSKSAFVNNVIKPIQTHFKDQFPNFYEQNIVLIGDDSFIVSILLSLLLSIPNSNEFQRSVSFKFFYIPTTSGIISRFLSKNDPMYHQLISNLYQTINDIAPVLNDNSEAFMPEVEDETEKEVYSSNLWFSDPSPSNILKIGIQHFLLYANSIVSIPVWKCIIEFKDQPDKFVIVPMILSLHIGNQFVNKHTGKFTDESSSRPRSANLNFRTAANERVEMDNERITSIALWNAEANLHSQPTDGFLMMQIARNPNSTDNARHDVIINFRFELSRSEPFNIMIDKRAYEGVKSVNVAPLESFDPRENVFKLRFATFTPFQKEMFHIDSINNKEYGHASTVGDDEAEVEQNYHE